MRWLAEKKVQLGQGGKEGGILCSASSRESVKTRGGQVDEAGGTAGTAPVLSG